MPRQCIAAGDAYAAVRPQGGGPRWAVVRGAPDAAVTRWWGAADAAFVPAVDLLCVSRSDQRAPRRRQKASRSPPAGPSAVPGAAAATGHVIDSRGLRHTAARRPEEAP